MTRCSIEGYKHVHESSSEKEWDQNFKKYTDDILQSYSVQKINPNSKAYNEGVQVGDYLETVNGHPTQNLNIGDTQQIIKNSKDELLLELRRSLLLDVDHAVNMKLRMSLVLKVSLSNVDNAVNKWLS
ncbi:hypothetical protein LOTGIDRAFT_154108 [Lottia gigantea]|uniref:PDZ domain-containing protein n=1 Tax=Lottia gigantea TaxID=225164 RepID=V3ZD50_LOTGI|nr:hypothetical protein LOTGIDRAFT_154108 [Lottia gigantea]ESO89033.1 hypothetical protein LOTGIDRAFT_154108 [Lottia gigantea]